MNRIPSFGCVPINSADGHFGHMHTLDTYIQAQNRNCFHVSAAATIGDNQVKELQYKAKTYLATWPVTITTST